MAESSKATPECKQSLECSIGAANCDFAVKVHKKLADDEENVFFSPFSLSVAMSMLLRGTKEGTAKEIAETLGFDALKLSVEEVHNSHGELLSTISESEAYILAVANALVSQKDFQLMTDYKEDLQSIYKAIAWEMDLLGGSVQEALSKINDWVKTNTRGMIPKVLEALNPSTVLVLLNAVYFKGSWKCPFDTKKTRPMEFYNRGIDSMVKKVPMMSIKKYFLFSECPNYKALEMPYKGDDVAMLLLLPRERNGLVELESSLGKDFLKSVRENLRSVEVTVTLPKLHLEYSKTMNNVLQKLGTTAIFDHTRANFKGMSESEQLEVSDVIHKAVIDVNEEGSEAAAVTAVMMMKCCMFIGPEIKFEADHPFLFVIYHKRNGMILFMGRVFEL